MLVRLENARTKGEKNTEYLLIYVLFYMSSNFPDFAKALN